MDIDAINRIFSLQVANDWQGILAQGTFLLICLWTIVLAFNCAAFVLEAYWQWRQTK